jgi:SSS family solute:Na+ symporter
LRVGQVVTGLMVVLSLAWIPFMNVISSGLYTYIQSVQSYISPPIAAVFLVGVLWSRANAKGAMAALLVGFVIGAGRLLLEMNKDVLSGAWLTFASINYLHFALLLFALSVLILVVFGLASAPDRRGEIASLVLWSREKRNARDKGTLTNLVLSAGVLVIIAIIWIYFS